MTTRRGFVRRAPCSLACGRGQREVESEAVVVERYMVVSPTSSFQEGALQVASTHGSTWAVHNHPLDCARVSQLPPWTTTEVRSP